MSQRTNQGRSRDPAFGARASHAGNEFHFRYAARRALRLLDPTSGLTILRVENGEVPPPEGAEFLAIDLSEYYGAGTLTNGSRVVATQLKYSTVHPDQCWTVSRLCQGSGRGRPSVIRRLAEAFRDYSSVASREDVVTKLTLRLVTNQPVAKGATAALHETKCTLKSFGNELVETAILLRSLGSSDRQVIDRLHRTSRLRSAEFCDFLRVLDLGGGSEPGLEEQDRLLLQEAGPMLGDSHRSALRGLVELVRTRALPRYAFDRGLSLDDVVVSLGESSADDLLPAPSRFEELNDPIVSGDIASLASLVKESGSGPLIAHGPPGVGKTTTVRMLSGSLPQGSEVLIYDCWGQGECKDYGSGRHSPYWALKQIYNEISFRMELPPLIGKISDVHELESRLKKRMELAAEIVRSRGGLLILAIDAADNAVQTAQDLGERSFIENMWRWTLPEGSHLLVTARTGRRDLLGAPEDARQVELEGFGIEASTEHLRRYFPEATAEECRRFDVVTQHNPRLQAYKLKSATGGTKPNLKRALDLRIKSLSELFAEYVRTSFEDVADTPQAQALLASFIVMSRPVAAEDLAEANGVPVSKADDFLKGLSPGVVMSDQGASVRDEDFDEYLRSKLTDADFISAHARIAGLLAVEGLNSPLAARSIWARCQTKACLSM